MTQKVRTAKASFGYKGRIVVGDCPFCHRAHYHNPPVGEGQRTADCFLGEYILDFSEGEPEPENLEIDDEQNKKIENTLKGAILVVLYSGLLVVICLLVAMTILGIR